MAKRPPLTSADTLKLLGEIGRAVTGTVRLREVLGEVLRAVSLLLEPETWALLLVDPERGDLRFEVAVGESAETLEGQRLPLGVGVAGWVAHNAECLVLDRVGDDPRFAEVDANPESPLVPSLQARFQDASVLCLPLIFGGTVLGVIELVRLDRLERGAFSFADAILLEPFAGFAAIAINNAHNFERIEQLTLTDEWTGLRNARFLRGYLPTEIARSRRYGRELSVMFIDLDGFKQVNDTWGHSTGSALLRRVGVLLCETVRDADSVIRYGGDEFTVILPETSLLQALQVGERVRAAVEEAFRTEGVTASIGVATHCADRDDSDALLGAADRAMYRAKAQGKNQVVEAD